MLFFISGIKYIHRVMQPAPLFSNILVTWKWNCKYEESLPKPRTPLVPLSVCECDDCNYLLQGDSQYLAFCDWLMSLIVMFLKVHLCWVSEFYSFLRLITSLCVQTTSCLSIHLDGHLCFFILALFVHSGVASPWDIPWAGSWSSQPPVDSAVGGRLTLGCRGESRRGTAWKEQLWSDRRSLTVPFQSWGGKFWWVCWIISASVWLGKCRCCELVWDWKWNKS